MSGLGGLAVLWAVLWAALAPAARVAPQRADRPRGGGRSHGTGDGAVAAPTGIAIGARGAAAMGGRRPTPPRAMAAWAAVLAIARNPRGPGAWAALLLLAGAAAAPAQTPDTRRMLSVEDSRAWVAVGRVNIATQSRLGLCTGTLIEPDLVLTAAHCVIDPLTDAPYAPGNVHFVAGWRGGAMAAASKAARVTLHPDYLAQTTAQARLPLDLALIRLATPLPGGAVPPFRLGAEPIALDTATPLTLISYRRDRPHALTRQDGCTLAQAGPTLLRLTCAVTFGASGSPLFVLTDQGPRVVAVLSAMGRDPAAPTALAVRLDTVLGPLLDQAR